MFQIGDKIVHPMYGAGVVDDITTRKINGVTRDYYVLKLPVGGMMVMIPTENSQGIGVRPVMTLEQAEEIIAALPELETDNDPNWNRRYRENMERLKSGDLMQVAKVLKSLTLRDRARGLSTGERKMLYSARQILVSEIGMAEGADYEDVERRIDGALTE